LAELVQRALSFLEKLGEVWKKILRPYSKKQPFPFKNPKYNTLAYGHDMGLVALRISLFGTNLVVGHSESGNGKLQLQLCSHCGFG